MSKWSLKLLFLELEMLDSNLILFDLVTDVNQLLSVHSDELQVFTGNIIVIFLHLSESVLVIFHELIDVLILSLLNLVNFYFHSKFEFFLESLHFSFIVSNERFSLKVEIFFEILVRLVELLLLILDFTLIGCFFSNVGLFLLFLLSKHVSVALTVVGVLFLHDFLRVDGNFVAVCLMSIF